MFAEMLCEINIGLAAHFKKLYYILGKFSILQKSAWYIG